MPRPNSIPMQSYGNVSEIYIHDRLCRCASDGERLWLKHIEPMLAAGEIVKFVWQPKPGERITYQHGGQECAYIYEPDAIITWSDGDEWTIEIKRGALHQRAATKMKRFCQQNPDRKLVLVWFGKPPRRGKVKRRYDNLLPWLDHVWEMK